MDIEEQLGHWWPLLRHVFNEPWMQKLGKRIGAVPKENLAPSLDNVFRAFRLCSPEDLKVIICLQDPYINGEADGLAMSSYGKMTPSLEVAFAEINRNHFCKRTQTHLDDWAEQGVLLINSCLTTVLGKSRAHQGWGWELFTQEVFHAIRGLDRPHVFMLWGKDAQALLSGFKSRHAVANPWKILKTHHPQAQNYNPANKFVGCNHFIEANLHLLEHEQFPIWWPDPGADKNFYIQYCETLLKQIPNASTHIAQILHSYAPVPGQPHPYNDGLGQKYEDDLPF